MVPNGSTSRKKFYEPRKVPQDSVLRPSLPALQPRPRPHVVLDLAAEHLLINHIEKGNGGARGNRAGRERVCCGGERVRVEQIVFRKPLAHRSNPSPGQVDDPLAKPLAIGRPRASPPTNENVLRIHVLEVAGRVLHGLRRGRLLEVGKARGVFGDDRNNIRMWR